MDEYQIHIARTLFRARVDSLRNDVARCFWPINQPSAPQYAPFPAVMYCFAIVDYFSGFWQGWNDPRSQHRAKRNQTVRMTDFLNDPRSQHRAKRNQTVRMTDFLCKYLRYPRKEAFIAVAIWRHKLMHTSEPRPVTSSETPPRRYVWRCGIGGEHHMHLQQIGNTDEYVLYFDCNEFLRDLEEGIFGPAGYFTALLRNEGDLQQNYFQCYNEMEQYPIDLSPINRLVGTERPDA